MSEYDDDYPCIGVCAPDPETGLCLGCGRPLLVDADSSAERRATPAAFDADQTAASAKPPASTSS
jgi:predicted Fe-S protein YdhL (DUF1289 family)